MGTALGLVLFALGGVLAGGAWSVHRQGGGRGLVVLLVVLAVVAVAGGLLRLWG